MLPAILAFILLIAFPEAASSGALAGLRQCGMKVIPSLFPFFVFSRLIASKMPPVSWNGMKRCFGVSGSVLPALLLSFLGGYPVGISTLVTMYEQGQITRQDAQRAMVFCNNSGPGIFTGLIGGVVFKSISAGLWLYGIHVISALICGTLFAKAPTEAELRRCPPEPVPFSSAFAESVSGAASAMLQVSAYVILFSVFSALLSSFSFFESIPAPVQALIMGALEMTSGLSALEATTCGFISAAAIMGWGGLCVHLQAMSLWQKADLHPAGYWAEKLLHAGLSACLAAALCQNVIFFCLLLLFLLFVIIINAILKKHMAKGPRVLYNRNAR